MLGQLFLQGCEASRGFRIYFSAVEEGAYVSGIHVDDFTPEWQVEGGLSDAPFQRKGILMDIVYETQAAGRQYGTGFRFRARKDRAPSVQCYFHMILLFVMSRAPDLWYYYRIGRKKEQGKTARMP